MSFWRAFCAAVEAAQEPECPAPPWAPEALAELRRVSGPRAARVGTTKGEKMMTRTVAAFDPYCLPGMAAMRRDAAVCVDAACYLSGGYAHAGPCEP